MGRCESGATNFWTWKDEKSRNHKPPSAYEDMKFLAFCNLHMPGSEYGCIKRGALKPMGEELHAAYLVVEE